MSKKEVIKRISKDYLPARLLKIIGTLNRLALTATNHSISNVFYDHEKRLLIATDDHIIMFCKLGVEEFMFIHSNRPVFEGIDRSCYLLSEPGYIVFEVGGREFPTTWEKHVPNASDLHPIIYPLESEAKIVFMFDAFPGMEIPLFIRASHAPISLDFLKHCIGYDWKGYEDQEDLTSPVLLVETSYKQMTAVIMPFRTGVLSHAD